MSRLRILSLFLVVGSLTGAFFFFSPANHEQRAHHDASIQQCSSMAEVKTHIDAVLKDIKPNDVLIAFDIDMTLVQPPYPEASYPALIKYRGMYEEIFKGCTGDVKDMALMLAVSDVPQILIEKETPAFVKELQSCGAKTMAFTASFVGKIEAIERFEVLRYETLKRRGMSFEKTFDKEELILKDLPMTHGYHPMMYRGILCANGGHKDALGKGSVMVAFLNEMNLHPKVLILVDDKKRHLEDVAQHLKQAYPAIRFLGLEYRGAMAGETTVTAEQFKAFWKGLAERAKGVVGGA